MKRIIPDMYKKNIYEINYEKLKKMGKKYLFFDLDNTIISYLQNKPTKENKIPFTIGDLKEGIKFYDRRQLSLMVSQTAVVGEGEDALNAFEEDLTLIRGIEREDARMRDDEAFVNGYIEITTAKTPETNTEAGSGKQESPETQGV